MNVNLFYSTVLVMSLLVAMLGSLAGYFHLRSEESKRRLGILNRLSGKEETELHQRTLKKLATSVKMQKILAEVPLSKVVYTAIEDAGWDMTVAQYYLIYVGVIVGTLVLAHFLAIPLAFRVIVLILALFGPWFWLYRGVMLYRNKFDEQLPEALNMIIMFLKAGRSFPQSFGSAVDELNDPLASYFRGVFEEYQLGRSLEDALNRLADKFPSSIGFRIFTVAVSMVTQSGGNLVEVLEGVKSRIEANLMFYAKFNAMTAEARGNAITMAALPGLFLLFSYWQKPESMQIMFEGIAGLLVFAAFLVFWLGGIIWVYLLLQAKVE